MDQQQRELVEKIIEWRHDFVKNNSEPNDQLRATAQELAQTFEERYNAEGAQVPYYSALTARHFYAFSQDNDGRDRMDNILDNFTPPQRTIEVVIEDMMAREDIAEGAATVAIWEARDDVYTKWDSIRDDLQSQGFQNAALSDLQTMFAQAHNKVDGTTAEPAQDMVAVYEPSTPQAGIPSMSA